MNKEVISDQQGISIIILFLVGSISIFGVGAVSHKDTWLSIILALMMVLPLVFIYIRLHNLFPENNFFDILEICWGKIISKIILLIYVFWLLGYSADVFTIYGQFITSTSLESTPIIVPVIVLGVLSIWVLKDGIETLGRWSEFFVYFPYALLIFALILLVPQIDRTNITPVFKDGFKPTLEGGFQAFTYPLSQIAVFTLVFKHFSGKKSAKKVYLSGLLIAFLYIFIIVVISLAVLGPDIYKEMYYPIYKALARINVGELLQRLEIIMATSFILGGFVKISILLLCASKAFKKLFDFDQYRFIVVPLTLISLNLTYFLHDDVMSYFEYSHEIWPFLLLPLSTIMPVLTWIIAELKHKKIKKLD